MFRKQIDTTVISQITSDPMSSLPFSTGLIGPPQDPLLCPSLEFADLTIPMEEQTSFHTCTAAPKDHLVSRVNIRPRQPELIFKNR